MEALRIHREPSEVERPFANREDVIELRAVYDQTDARVRAHVFVAALAFLLHRAIEETLKDAGLDPSATEALQTRRSAWVVDFTLDGGSPNGA